MKHHKIYRFLLKGVKHHVHALEANETSLSKSIGFESLGQGVEVFFLCSQSMMTIGHWPWLLEFATVALFCDSRCFRRHIVRLSHFFASVWTGFNKHAPVASATWRKYCSCVYL